MAGLPPDLHAQTFNLLTYNIKFQAVDEHPDIECNPITSPSLPIHSVAVHCSTPIMQIIPPHFCHGNYVMISLLYNGFQLLVCLLQVLPRVWVNPLLELVSSPSPLAPDGAAWRSLGLKMDAVTRRLPLSGTSSSLISRRWPAWAEGYFSDGAQEDAEV